MVHVIHVLFVVFARFENLKASLSLDNMPVHAIDVLIENATKMLLIIAFNRKLRIKL